MGIGQGLCVIGESEGPAGTEAALLRAGQAGDRAALEQLLALHERPLLALCHGILAHAEDAEAGEARFGSAKVYRRASAGGRAPGAQETFLRVLRALPRFRPGQAQFRTWLFRIAVNVCLNWKRGRRRTQPWDDEHSALSTDAACPESIALSRLQVMEALRELPPRHRAIFLLKVQGGWSVAEIGAAMGWSPIRAQNELSKARRALAEWQARRDQEGAEP